MKMAKVEGFIDNSGEAKSIGTTRDTTGKDIEAGMAAFIAYPELYRCRGTLYFIRCDVPWWKRMMFFFFGVDR